MVFILSFQVLVITKFLQFLCFSCVAPAVVSPRVSVLWGAGPLFCTQLHRCTKLQSASKVLKFLLGLLVSTSRSPCWFLRIGSRLNHFVHKDCF